MGPKPNSEPEVEALDPEAGILANPHCQAVVAYNFDDMLQLLTFGVSNYNMIVSFGNKDTERVWLGERVKRLPNEVQSIGRRKLRMVNNSQNVMDLTIPPADKLEKLKGNLKEYYSIRINDQWRIIFKWINGNAF
jgi:toxin HigB-1